MGRTKSVHSVPLRYFNLEHSTKNIDCNNSSIIGSISTVLQHAGQAILVECSKVLGKQNDSNRNSLPINFLAAAIDLQDTMGRNEQLHFLSLRRAKMFQFCFRFALNSG